MALGRLGDDADAWMPEIVEPGQGLEARHPKRCVGKPCCRDLPSTDDGRARPGGERHAEVPEPGVTELEHVRGGEPHRGVLVGEHVHDVRVDRCPGPDERDAAGDEVGHHRVVPVATQREDRRIDRLRRELGHGSLGIVGRLGHEEHRATGGIELTGEAVEDAEGERVAERVLQRALHDHGDGPHAAVAQ